MKLDLATRRLLAHVRDTSRISKLRTLALGIATARPTVRGMKRELVMLGGYDAIGFGYSHAA